MHWIKRPALAGLVSLLWLATVTSLYYISHKPFSPAFAASLLLTIWRLCVALAIVSVAGGVGRRLLALKEMPPLAALASQTALGLGLLSLGMLLVGTAGVLNRPLLALSLVLLFVFFLKDIRRWWSGWRELRVLWGQSEGLGRAIAVGTGIILFCTLFTALAPPIKYDALVYHLALPHAYIEAGRVAYIPWNMFWGMPQVGEMLYTWAILLGGDSSASTLGWLFGVLACIGLVGFIAGRFGARTAWVSLAAVLSGATLAMAFGWSYVDWLAALYGLAFLVTMDLWASKGQRHIAGLAGVYAGLAFGAKYTAGVLIIAGLVCILLFGWRKRIPALSASGFQFLLAAGLVASPWLIKNSLATGNPLYPFLFPAAAMDIVRLNLYQNQPTWAHWRDYILLPWQATMNGVQGKEGYNASIGPLLLGLGLLGAGGLVVRRGTSEGDSTSQPAEDAISHKGERCTVENAAIIVGAGLLVWALAGSFSAYLLQTRLYLALFPAAALLAAAGFSGLEQVRWSGVRFGRIGASLVLLVFWLNVLEVGLSTLHEKPLSVALGTQSSQAYLEDNLGWYIRAAQAVRALPDGARVLMLWEPRSHYCAPKCIPDEVLDRWLRSRPQSGKDAWIPPDVTLKTWREEGFTHLLYHQAGADFLREGNAGVYRPEDWEALTSLLSRLPPPEDFGGDYLLYSLAP